MSRPKPHLEFVGVDLKRGWESPGPNYPPGFSQKILASDLDEATQRGSRTRLLRIAPGVTLWSRKPFELHAPSEFDNLLAWRFDDRVCGRIDSPIP